ncbi:B12-binding domain-containing radical SAM protein [candidate division KSB1 bacterium]|nr:B12-binding domain-containing radical SAM protein [candidate division KSB1 bacterium]
MNVILLDPSKRNNIQEPYENIGLGYLAAVLRSKNHSVRIINCAIEKLSFREVISCILKFKPDVLGITVKSVNIRRAIDVVTHLRNCDFRGHVTLGGHYATVHHSELLRDFPAISSVVRGEGELALLDLVENVKTGNFTHIKNLSYRKSNSVIINDMAETLTPLDELPFPARDDTARVIQKDGSISISASRGCYASCSFCSIAHFYNISNGPRWRRRSPQNIAAEIEYLSRTFHTSKFKFIDDQLFLSNRSALKFVRELQAELQKRHLTIQFSMNCRANHITHELFALLKSIGLKKVFIGIESAHQRGLDTFNKGTSVQINNDALTVLDELNIDYDIGFILIDPYTTFDELTENLNYLSTIKKRIEGRHCYLSVTTSLEVFGGTPVCIKLQNEGRLTGDYFNGYHYMVEDANVKRYQFIMEHIIEQKLVAFYHRLLYLKRSFINRERNKITNLRRFHYAQKL